VNDDDRYRNRQAAWDHEPRGAIEPLASRNRSEVGAAERG
jgi:hypothetical protein